MESLFLKLKKNMEKQKENLKLLLKTAREHNRALRQLDAGVLSAIVSKEGEISKLIDQCESERKKLTLMLSGTLEINEDAGFAQLIDRAPDGVKVELTIILSSMREIAQELSEINGLNSALTRQAMKFNEIFLRAFSQAEAQVYAPNGRKVDDSLQVSLLDKKI